jgi:4-hydroxybenzoate polyprenyltransferase
MNINVKSLHPYIKLLRLDKPIGIFLLLWPTLWALWIAADGMPHVSSLMIFVSGVVVMRSAGCVINDIADRHVDGLVARTHLRPLAAGELTVKQALQVFVGLCLVALVLVLLTDLQTILLSVVALFLAAVYPFMKRYTYLPQVVLGAAFGWAIPMAFSVEGAAFTEVVWLLFTANLLWTVAYDTLYAMVDREDDIKAGVKSTAILFGDADIVMVALLQILAMIAFILVGLAAELGVFYYGGVAVATALMAWQHWHIRGRDTQAYFKAFLHNNWVGAALFAGLVLNYGI